VKSGIRGFLNNLDVGIVAHNKETAMFIRIQDLQVIEVKSGKIERKDVADPIWKFIKRIINYYLKIIGQSRIIRTKKNQ
jgi:hypothetical protein